MPALKVKGRVTVINSYNSGWPLHFLVFSFNRGELLAHCIDSIRRCAPNCPITIHDDNSTDELTRQIITDLAADIVVVQPAECGVESKHGGLYSNMQRACSAIDDDVLICTLQDDMQMVRPLQRTELDHWHGLFARGQHCGFLQPAFLKGPEVTGSGANAVSYDSDKCVYLLDRLKRSAGAWYSDVFMIQAGLLRQRNWQFATRESGNEQQARQYFEQMGYLRNPFVAWLPGAPAWRGKRRTLALKWAEKSRRCGFYPFNIMSDEQSAAFCARDSGQLPIAETYLTLAAVDGKPADLDKPWFYYPLQNRRVLKLANRMELELSRLFAGSG
jgi:glycosyltransferase involved in cell wall biosynthesis